MNRIDGLSWLRTGRCCALLAGLMAVTGCGGGGVSNPFGTTETTGFSSERLPDSLPESQMAAAPAAAEAAAPSAADGKALNCPQVVAWPNERLRTTYQSGHDGDQLFVINRSEITKLSRECRFYGGRVTVKYGFAGRVLLGPKGKPGKVTTPVSIRAAGADKQTLATDKMSVSATVPSDRSAGYFSMVREITFPIRVGTRPEDYKIFVALK